MQTPPTAPYPRYWKSYPQAELRECPGSALLSYKSPLRPDARSIPYRQKCSKVTCYMDASVLLHACIYTLQGAKTSGRYDRSLQKSFLSMRAWK